MQLFVLTLDWRKNLSSPSSYVKISGGEFATSEEKARWIIIEFSIQLIVRPKLTQSEEFRFPREN